MLTEKLADVESKMDGLTKDSILLGERLANVGDTLKNIDERTKVLSDELINIL